MEVCREMEIFIDCFIDSLESIFFIINSLFIGVILEFYNYMKVKKLEVKDLFFWILKLINNFREFIN